jgi:Fe-S cluster biogenesis protein NfuA
MPEFSEAQRQQAEEFSRQVAAALAQIRPALQADGGDIELLEIVGTDARLRLVGACQGCPSAVITLREGVQRFLRQAVPGFGRVLAEELE